MKAQELRIGNYYIIGRDIKKLDCNLLVWYLEGGSDMFKPIPLTEEWLLRLRFEDTTDGWGNSQGMGFLYKKDEFYLCTVDYDSYWHLSNKTGQPKPNPKVEYVHQLQNLYFALTGEELTENKDITKVIKQGYL